MRPLLLLLALLLAGCSKSPTAANTPPPPPSAAKLTFTVQPSSATAGTGIAATVAIQDASGNTMTSATNLVTVALGANSVGGILSGTTTVNAVNGVATFSGLSINKAGTGYTLAASSSPLTSTTSAAFTIAPAAAVKLAFITVQPSTATAEVAIHDAYGNVVPSATDTVIIALGANPTGGTLLGITSVAAVNGVATFSNWGVKCGAGYTLTATASGLAGATSSAFSVTSCWTTKASMPTARDELGVGVVNGVLFAVGGNNGGYGGLRTVEAYDPTTDTWTTKASMPTPREGLGVGVVNGVLYAVGGDNGNGFYLGTVEAYDPTTNTWTTKASMPTRRTGLGVGVVNGVLYAVGGDNAGVYAPGAVEAYDPTTNTWTTKASIPPPMLDGRGVGVVNGVLYAVGGNSGGLGTAEAYDPSTDTWTMKASMPTPLMNMGVGVINGVLYAVGGNSNLSVGTVEAYDPSTDTWTTKPPMPTPRANLGVGVMNGVLYAVGGWNQPYNTGLGTVEMLQP